MSTGAHGHSHICSQDPCHRVSHPDVDLTSHNGSPGLTLHLGVTASYLDPQTQRHFCPRMSVKLLLLRGATVGDIISRHLADVTSSLLLDCSADG